jgi:hypothetical protein
VVLVDGAATLKDACSRHGLDYRYEKHGNRNSVERVFREIKRRTTSFLTVSATQIEKLLVSCYDHSIRMESPYLNTTTGTDKQLMMYRFGTSSNRPSVRVYSLEESSGGRVREWVQPSVDQHSVGIGLNVGET